MPNSDQFAKIKWLGTQLKIEVEIQTWPKLEEFIKFKT
jgi:hypothetical protein